MRQRTDTRVKHALQQRCNLHFSRGVKRAEEWQTREHGLESGSCRGLWLQRESEKFQLRQCGRKAADHGAQGNFMEIEGEKLQGGQSREYPERTE